MNEKRQPKPTQSAVPSMASVAAAIENAPADPPGLYIVSTPIGNLADVTLRALRILARADLIACEDTRVTRKLLSRYGIATPTISYHEHNAEARRPELIRRLGSGETVALVTDAGTPLVSDPGFRLVEAAQESGIAVFPVPGPSALLAGLVASGIAADRFWFEGFLPARQAARRNRIAELAKLDGPLVIYEAPHRVAAALADLSAGLGPRPAALARELTKRFETVLRGSLGDLAERISGEPTPKGEIVLVIGAGESKAVELNEAEIDEKLIRRAADIGVKRAAAELAAETGLRRADLYRRALELAGNVPRDQNDS